MKAKYDKIGANYNSTRKADPYITERLFHHLSVKRSELYLDIGCGTGNYTDALQSKGVRFIGIDPSEKMLKNATFKNDQIDWRIGKAENTNLENDNVSGIIASLTIHHWQNLNKAFNELYRVLKKEGTIVIFTSTPKQMKGYWLQHYFPKMVNDSILQMPSFEEVEEAMSHAGFTISGREQYSIKKDLKDLFLYAGKYNPKFYLNKQIRNGISSFTSLAHAEEVHTGLLKMKRDIESKKITEVMNSYKNDLGDYLFIIGKKEN